MKHIHVCTFLLTTLTLCLFEPICVHVLFKRMDCCGWSLFGFEKICRIGSSLMWRDLKGWNGKIMKQSL